MKDLCALDSFENRGLPSFSAERADAARLGLWLGIVALAMVFLGLLGSLIVSRGGTPRWPPEGVRLNLPLGSINTAVIVSSSLALGAALIRARKGQPEAARLSLQLGGALALVFLGLQALQYFWLISHFHETLSSSQFSTYFYALTGLHAAHLLGGVGWLLWLMARPRSFLALELCGRYWHFVTLVWAILFVFLYLI
jgi:heme/copper-type cytochrome/quinol oxidase subunit 3